ncbi:lysophospholipid acyltransferase family protein [Pseudobacteriovorax antillogorgiicola]|uniref:DUF374 domain-containing protein n=1 Tax=Pseudobacteriovorax antillogorgiicola TaxID=1513793 RepID=A0A1Y6BQD8_9BACT|nr:lysophospholipid acyltransferase family protein [Pseudobacteriovorax antillogorgiicola]TCS53733.1 hypothetical protein EDD56_10742 [Pseudobacteriovorax antillogorgiicola]SMF22724.1 hypothetical protein SAMN06296036_107230 [Pseudobacteriovorax antillogorgiicola]
MSWKERMICVVGFIFCRLLHLTYRYQVVYEDNRQKTQVNRQKTNFMIATWHENSLAGILSHFNQGILVLISRSFDGELVSFIASRFGLGTVRGSSSKGGKEARSELENRLSAGYSAAITVDGPRGPRHQVKPGIVALLKETKVPILPMAAIAHNPWVLSKTWDKTRIPKPFSKILVLYGKPIFDEGQDFASLQNLLATRLQQLESDSQRLLSQETKDMSHMKPHMPS